MDFLDKLLSSATLQYVLVGLIVLNAMLSALSQGLELIGKSDKLPQWVKSVSAALAKVIDWISANRKH